MNISLAWLNSLLDRPCTPDEAEHALTFAGFPLEGVEPLPGGDVRLDVEITSNRGDCLCHVGLAREIAAATGRKLVLPRLSEARSEPGPSSLTLENRVHDVCPRFTATVIEKATIAPSPGWLVQQLEAVGQRSINNAVDVTNWLNFAFGHPSHVFDLDKLDGRKLVVRWAGEGEALRTLDSKARTLAADELVVADAVKAASLAGVIGGADSEVSSTTRSIVLEVATWDPAVVRRAARRHQVRTDASHRFERVVDPRPLEEVNRFAAALIADLTGGVIKGDVLSAGGSLPADRAVSIRPERCVSVIGTPIGADEMVAVLDALELGPKSERDGKITCTIPAWRHTDLTREVDLIEEVARVRGYARVPLAEKLPVAVRPLQESEYAVGEIASVLAGLGFYETVTFSFVTPEQAAVFMPRGLEAVSVDEARRREAPTLRPSAIPNLMLCRKANADARNELPGGFRLYEIASAFAQTPGKSTAQINTRTVESRNLSLLLDIPGTAPGKRPSVEQIQHGVRLLRGAIEKIVTATVGRDAKPIVTPTEPASPAWDPAAHATIHLGKVLVGVFGVLSAEAMRCVDLDVPVVAADINIEQLVTRYPPRVVVSTLPAFPGIERDLSVVIPEQVAWAQVEEAARAVGLELMEGVAFVTTYRGKQLPAGCKSLTLRASFRDPTRTLRREEADTQMERLQTVLKERFGAEVRA